MSVGFIGLGNIGKPMAMHWAQGPRAAGGVRCRCRRRPSIWWRPARRPPGRLRSSRDKRKSSASACATTRKCEQLLSGPGGILENARPDTVVAIHSTVKQESILEWHERGKAKSLHIIDASVTRATEPGKFCYMLGGAAAIVERCRPLLVTGGNSVVHAGPVGAAIALKLCNNMMTYAEFIAMHEACKLARAFGLDPELLHEVSKVNGVVTPAMAMLIRLREQLPSKATRHCRPRSVRTGRSARKTWRPHCRVRKSSKCLCRRRRRPKN